MCFWTLAQQKQQIGTHDNWCPKTNQNRIRCHRWGSQLRFYWTMYPPGGVQKKRWLHIKMERLVDSFWKKQFETVEMHWNAIFPLLPSCLFGWLNVLHHFFRPFGQVVVWCPSHQHIKRPASSRSATGPRATPMTLDKNPNRFFPVFFFLVVWLRWHVFQHVAHISGIHWKRGPTGDHSPDGPMLLGSGHFREDWKDYCWRLILGETFFGSQIADICAEVTSLWPRPGHNFRLAELSQVGLIHRVPCVP